MPPTEKFLSLKAKVDSLRKEVAQIVRMDALQLPSSQERIETLANMETALSSMHVDEAPAAEPVVTARITIWPDGITYQADVHPSEKTVKIFRHDQGCVYFEGEGKWNADGAAIYDCSADLGADTYEQLDQAIAKALGEHAEAMKASAAAAMLAELRETADTFLRLAGILESALTWDDLPAPVRQKLTHAANLISKRCEPIRALTGGNR